MKRTILLVLLALMAAACGGSGGDSTETTASVGTDAPAESEATTVAPSSEGTPAASGTTAPPDDGGAGDGNVEGVGVGSATIAGETYEFGDLGGPGLQCLSAAFGVAFIAALEATDGRGGAIVVGIPFPGEEETAGIMPELGVGSDDLEWMANEERAAEQGIPVGSSQVDSYDIDGNTVSGTATFVEVNSTYTDTLVVETGTFEVTCADG